MNGFVAGTTKTINRSNVGSLAGSKGLYLAKMGRGWAVQRSPGSRATVIHFASSLSGMAEYLRQLR